MRTGLVCAALVAVSCAPAAATAQPLRVSALDHTAAAVIRRGALKLRVSGRPGTKLRVSAVLGGGRRTMPLVAARSVRLGRSGRRALAFRVTRVARPLLRAAVARCSALRVTAVGSAGRRRVRSRRRIGGGAGCGGPAPPGAALRPPGEGGGGAPAEFTAGAATVPFTPPAHGALATDPSDCAGAAAAAYGGPRRFAFEEPYVDLNGNGRYDAGEPYLDCNGNGRWDGNFLGGGGGPNVPPRLYTQVADPVGARALVVSNGARTIAVEVVDQEGLFNVYQERIRQRVAADGVHLDGIFISATHDESAPDTLGLTGVNQGTSSVNPYFVDYLVAQSARAIEDAYAARRPATLRYAEAREPANMRQCWSSYPYVDDAQMPVVQAVGHDGTAIATLASVSQHAETLGFNPSTTEGAWVSSDWPHYFRSALEARYGGVAVEMAGSVGSVESPEVFASVLSTVPQAFVDESHPAGCATLFAASGSHAPLGYDGETRAFGEQLAAAVEGALANAAPSRSNVVYGDRRDICVPVTNTLFRAAAAAGVFAARPTYTNGCTVEVPPAPNGATNGTELRSEVAAFRIGDGEFVSLPGEVFPFTFLRGFQGPQDMPYPQYPLPPWVLAHMHAPYRFLDGLGEDMIGYIFPQGNGVGVPGEQPATNPSANGTDRFGCGHSDDSESASSQAADIVGAGLTDLLDREDGSAEAQAQGRYVLGDGSVSRDPLGGPEIKCAQDQTFHADPAIAVDLPGAGVVRPAAWMSLSGRPQSSPDRDTRGYFDAAGRRVWLDVFPDVQVP